MAYNEIEQRGTADFPIAFFHLDINHPRYNMSAHWHTEIELIRVLEGEFEVTLNNNVYTAKKGDLIFINPETVHHGVPKNSVYECVVFNIDYLYGEKYDSCSFMKNVLDRESAVFEYYPYDDSDLQRAANDIFDAMLTDSLSHKFRVIAAIYNFFGVIIDNRLYSHNTGDTVILTDRNIKKLKKILSYLRENYDKAISLEEIGIAAKMSPKYLGSFFKNMTGKTPIEYLTEYRIEKAANKLRFTDLSVTDIAFSCGFSDLSYFIKTFKKNKGISPGKFRNKMLV